MWRCKVAPVPPVLELHVGVTGTVLWPWSLLAAQQQLEYSVVVLDEQSKCVPSVLQLQAVPPGMVRAWCRSPSSTLVPEGALMCRVSLCQRNAKFCSHELMICAANTVSSRCHMQRAMLRVTTYMHHESVPGHADACLQRMPVWHH